MITDRKFTIAVSGLKKLERDIGTIGICDRASAMKCRILKVR